MFQGFLRTVHGQESSGSRLFSAEELPWEGTPHPPKLGAFGSQVHQQPVNEGLGAAVDTKLLLYFSDRSVPAFQDKGLSTGC